MIKHILYVCILGSALCGAQFISGSVYAESKTSIIIHEPYASATVPTAKASAAFFTIKNISQEDDRLIGASTNIAGRVELHTHKNDGGIMMMRKIEAIDVPAQTEVILKPMGDHVMLMELRQGLTAGRTLDLTLNFEKSGEMHITVPIIPPGLKPH